MLGGAVRTRRKPVSVCGPDGDLDALAYSEAAGLLGCEGQDVGSCLSLGRVPIEFPLGDTIPIDGLLEATD